MYRLLKNASSKVNGTNISKLQFNQTFLSLGSFVNRDFSFIPGTNHLPNRLPTRNLTTAEIEKKKKIRKSRKKYAELLEVNEDSNHTTAAVVNELTALQIDEHLHNDATESSENLISNEDTLSFNNVNSLPIDHLLMEHEIVKGWQLIQPNQESIDAIPKISLASEEEAIISPKKIKSKTSIKKVPDSETIHNNKITTEEEQIMIGELNNNLASYIELCVHCDSLNVGFGALSRYSKKNVSKSQVFCSQNPRPFNSLMHGYAGKANFDKVMELMQMMRSCGISPNPQSYAAAFEALGRRFSDETVMGKLKFLEQEMHFKGFTFQHLFDHCSYIADQRECVLKSIHRLDPDFVPHYNSPVLHYDCVLLKEFNKKSNQPYMSPCRGLISNQEMEVFIDEQIKTELSSSVMIKSVLPPPVINTEIEQYRAKWNNLQSMWTISIREALSKELQILELQLSSTKLCYSINIYPYLKALTAEEYIDIILQEIHKLLQGSELFSSSSKQLQKNLGDQVHLKYQIKQKQQYGIADETEKIYKNYCNWYLNPETNPTNVNTRQQWQHLLHSSITEGASLDDNELIWPPNIIEEIGKFLYNIIMHKIKTDVNCCRPNSTPEYLPAFCSLLRYLGNKVILEGHPRNKLIEEFKPHPQLVKLYKESHFDELAFDVNQLPMVSPPVPWTTPKTGGYVIAKTDFIRLDGLSNKIIEDLPPQKLYPAIDCLNQLSAVPWRVNEKVLDVILEVFLTGGSARLDVPQDISSYVPTNLPFDNSNETLTYEQKFIIDKKRTEMSVLWCDALNRLSLANHYRRRIFWLPHNIDFCGRTDLVSQQFTLLGNDMGRSLLRFAKGMKLGPKGLDWLKIHCINLTGLKKSNSLADRLKYADEMLPDILDSAEKPLTGNMWWAESEEQWQTLACCMEIKAAIDSGDAENFISHLPVHQYVSCSGLQHYVALGRDEAGAKGINLAPSDTPKDVCSCVVDLVETKRSVDAAKGVEIARSLEGFITRQLIKQTVMNAIYGVTRFDARARITKQLKDINEFPNDLILRAANYLSSKTSSCLQEMFTSSLEIQDWLTDCAKFISTHCSSNVEWQTPLGLPILLPYSETKVSHALSGKNSQINNLTLDVILKPIVIKQKDAFASNFIQSLDSSHVMLTSLFCERKDITFVSVDDCFWTHPCTVDEMSEIGREQFVALHSEQILENLSKYLMERYSDAYINSLPPNLVLELPLEVLKKVPPKGTFDLRDVLKSTYFFS